jgi:hypothetical protein
MYVCVDASTDMYIYVCKYACLKIYLQLRKSNLLSKLRRFSLRRRVRMLKNGRANVNINKSSARVYTCGAIGPQMAPICKTLKAFKGLGFIEYILSELIRYPT